MWPNGLYSRSSAASVGNRHRDLDVGVSIAPTSDEVTLELPNTAHRKLIPARCKIEVDLHVGIYARCAPFFLSVHFISYGGAFLHFIKKRTDNLFPLSFENRMVLKFRKRQGTMHKGMLGSAPVKQELTHARRRRPVASMRATGRLGLGSRTALARGVNCNR